MTQTVVEMARKLVDMARGAAQEGEMDKCLAYFDDAIALFEHAAGQPFLADLLRWKGTVFREQGETEAAFRCYSKSLAHAERAGDIRAKAHSLNCLAIVAQRRGDIREC